MPKPERESPIANRPTHLKMIDEYSVLHNRGGGGELCLPDSKSCNNSSQYAFWDGVHPTETLNKIIAKNAYTSKFPLNASPLNIQQLAMWVSLSPKHLVDSGISSNVSVVPLQSKTKKSVEYSPRSSSDPSSVPDHSTAQTNGSRFNCNGEDEVAKAICLEKGSLVDEFSSEINVVASLGEKVFLGNLQPEEIPPLNNLETSIPNQISSEAVRSVSNVNSVEAFGPGTCRAVSKIISLVLGLKFMGM
ncbi:hypothetical protein V6N11_025119 [Hibiscus sabdariffa]|uniref:GDSL esterase/lipase n=1 Tax=Hibiscus sabdariffa TaxID=183260 RepID=A0ABR2QP60_9ROSI